MFLQDFLPNFTQSKPIEMHPCKFTGPVQLPVFSFPLDLNLLAPGVNWIFILQFPPQSFPDQMSPARGTVRGRCSSGATDGH